MPYSQTTWIDNAAPDISAANLNHLEAGVAAAIPKDVVTGAGDLLYATGNATVARLGIGGAGQVLIPSGAAPAWGAIADLAYVEFTAPVSISATTEATANQVVSAGALTFDGSPIWLEFFAPYFTTHNVAGAAMVAVLYDGASSAGYLSLTATPANAILDSPVLLKRRFTPSAVAHTYSVRVYTSAGTATVGAGAWGAAAYPPGYIRITRA